jgi:hypothetical protein
MEVVHADAHNRPIERCRKCVRERRLPGTVDTVDADDDARVAAIRDAGSDTFKISRRHGRM